MIMMMTIVEDYAKYDCNNDDDDDDDDYGYDDNDLFEG